MPESGSPVMLSVDLRCRAQRDRIGANDDDTGVSAPEPHGARSPAFWLDADALHPVQRVLLLSQYWKHLQMIAGNSRNGQKIPLFLSANERGSASLGRPDHSVVQ